MKTPSLTTLLAACGFAITGGGAAAQDNNAGKPQPADNPPPAEQRDSKPLPPRGPGDSDRPRPGSSDHPRGPQDSNRNRGDHDGQEHRGPRSEMKPTAYIGVFTRALSDEVRAQTGLAEGFGLIVEEVMPDSPAQAAGLKQHDVLVLLGDQKLVNQDQLAALVRAEKKDAEVVFTLRRAGAEQKVTVKIGEKMMPVTFEREIQRGVIEPFRNFMNGKDAERFGQQMREQAERFNKGMKEFGERMQDWSRNPQGRSAPQHGREGDGDRGPGAGSPGHRPQSRPQGEDQGPRGGSVSSSSSSSSNGNAFQRNVVRRDDSGEYSLSENNGDKVFTVKPSSGEGQTFNVTTDEQRKAVPETFKAKLRELENVDGRVKAEEPPAPPPPSDQPKPGI